MIDELYSARILRLAVAVWAATVVRVTPTAVVVVAAVHAEMAAMVTAAGAWAWAKAVVAGAAPCRLGTMAST